MKIFRLKIPLRGSVRSVYVGTSSNMIQSSLCSPDDDVKALKPIYNSLDADATSIAVRVDLNKHRIQVVDNGRGVSSEDLISIGQRYMTSKCQSLYDLKHNLDKFGFRGEALASIINISESVNITSLHYKNSETHVKEFFKGFDEKEKKTKDRPSHGTTVTIENFLYNLGVRQKRVDSTLNMEEIRLSMETIALVHFHVSFSLRDDSDGRLVLKTHKNKSIREAFFFLLDERVGDNLQSFTVTEEKYVMEGHIARGTHINKILQYVYVNKRPVKNCEIQTVLNKQLVKKSFHFREQNNKYGDMNCKIVQDREADLKAHCKIKKYPVFIVNLSCPYISFDISSMPDKSVVEFKEPSIVRKLVKMLVNEFVKSELGSTQSEQKEDIPVIKDEESKDLGIDELLKKVLTKNVECFGPSQINNAIKGFPAKRKLKENQAHAHHKSKQIEIDNSKSHTAKNCTPNQDMGVLLKLTAKRKDLKRIGQKRIINLNKRKIKDWPSFKLRETPLLLSQLISFKKSNRAISNKPEYTKTHKLFREIGINVNILSKKVEKQTNNKKSTYIKSVYKNSTTCLINKNKLTNTNVTRLSQSSIFQLNFDSHKNFHMANLSKKNIFLNEIEKWIKNDSSNGNGPTERFDHAMGKTEQKTLMDLWNQNGMKEYYSIKHTSNVERHQIKRFVNSRTKLEPPVIQKTYDMIKTVISGKNKPRKESNNLLANYNAKTSCEYMNADNLYFDSNIEDRLQFRKNSSVQTDLKLSDIEMMIISSNDYRGNNDVLKNNYKNDFGWGFSSLPNIELDYSLFNCDKFTKDSLLNTPNCIIEKSVNKRKSRINIEPKTIQSNLVINETTQSDTSDGGRIKDFSIQMGENLMVSFVSTNDENNEVHFKTAATVNEESKDTNQMTSVCNDLKISKNQVDKSRHNNSKLHCNFDDDKSESNENNINPIDMIILDDDHNKSQNSFYAFSPIIVEDNKMETGSVKILTVNREMCSDREKNDRNRNVNESLNAIQEINESFLKAGMNRRFETLNTIQHNDSFLSDSLKDCWKNEFKSESKKNYSKSMSILKTLDSSFDIFDKSDDLSNEIIPEKNKLNSFRSKTLKGDFPPMIRSQNNKTVDCFENVKVTIVENKTGHKSSNEEETEWEIKTDSLGKVFYINKRTGMTLYENPIHKKISPYKVFKRPGFVPKGMSPILKLEENNKVILKKFGESELKNDEGQSPDALTKVKWAEPYYHEEMYSKFASKLLENLDFLEDGTYAGNKLQIKRYSLFKPIVFDKTMLSSIKVINQVDNKFIVTIMEDKKSRLLVLFDQHAVHERIRLEALLKESKEDNKWKTTSVRNPVTVNIHQSDMVVLMKYKQNFEELGLYFVVSKPNEGQINIKSVPSCFQYTKLKEDDSLLHLVEQLINEELDVFKSTKGNSSRIPKAIMEVISSKACHGAIKFGVALSKTECEELVRSLQQCQVPFQCAHGRPVLSVLADLKDVRDEEPRVLNMSNIKKYLKEK